VKQKDYDLEYRKYVIAGVAALIVFIYIVRLFMLQITSDDYKKSADSNAFLKKIEYPSRGAILDRTGKLMVYNQPSYDIMVVMNEMKDRLDTLDFCEALGISSEEFDRRMAMRNCRTFKTAAEIQPVLDFLDDYGYIVRKPEKVITGGRPPLPKYVVNPVVLSQLSG
jgi:cell division protein FtsI/penicillin-binding protein 2